MNRQRCYAASIAIAWFALFLNQASATQPTIAAKSSATTVQVAEPFTIDWVVKVPGQAKVTFPFVGKQFGDFDVVDSKDLFDVPDDIGLKANGPKARTWTRRMTLESINSGQLTIPELEVRVSDPNGSRVLKAERISINVASVLEDRSDPTQFRDIESVVNVDVPVTHSQAWIGWTMGGIVGLTMLAIIGMLVSRRGKWVTPKEWAMNEFDELESSIDAGTADSEDSALKLSEIVRSFLLFQLGIMETGNTPQELLHQIALSKRVGTDATNRLRELFTLADKAKFAGLELSVTGLKSALRDSRELVKRITSESESTPTA